MIVCDRCDVLMEDDETGVFLINEGIGGHMKCFREKINASEYEGVDDELEKK